MKWVQPGKLVREVEAVCGCFWGGRCGAEGERERARGLVWALDRALGLGGGCTRRDVDKRVLGCRTAVVAAVYCVVGRTEGRSRERRWRSRPAEASRSQQVQEAEGRTGGRRRGLEAEDKASQVATSTSAPFAPLPDAAAKPNGTFLPLLDSSPGALVTRRPPNPPNPPQPAYPTPPVRRLSNACPSGTPSHHATVANSRRPAA
jgi:hypothetical protein